jgi:hypothetical protein
MTPTTSPQGTRRFWTIGCHVVPFHQNLPSREIHAAPSK